MEQMKNEPMKENKTAPDTGKPKKEREPLTEAQRLKRQKMIVLPAMVLVFIGVMWLIFAPSSGKEQPPGTDGESFSRSISALATVCSLSMCSLSITRAAS